MLSGLTRQRSYFHRDHHPGSSNPAVSNMTDVQNSSSKEDVGNVEKIEQGHTGAAGLSEEEEQFLATFPPEREAKIYRKVSSQQPEPSSLR